MNYFKKFRLSKEVFSENFDIKKPEKNKIED